MSESMDGAVDGAKNVAADGITTAVPFVPAQPQGIISVAKQVTQKVINVR